MQEAIEGECCTTRATTHLARTFKHGHVDARGGKRDRSRQAVRPAANNNSGGHVLVTAVEVTRGGEPRRR